MRSGAPGSAPEGASASGATNLAPGGPTPQPASPPPRSETPGPWWLNAATVKGSGFILAGLLILVFPSAGESLIRVSISLLLVISGASRMVFSVRNRRFAGTRQDILEAGVSVIAGIALLAAPVETIQAIGYILAAFAVLEALTLLVPLIFAGRAGFRVDRLVRGLMFLAIGGLLFLVPEAVIGAALVVVAALAVAIGGLMLALGLQKAKGGKRIEASAVTVWAVFLDWLKARNMGQDGRYELGQKLYFEKPERTNKIVTWSVMLLLSVAIATFGVLQDSTAVVIGAMLIAPLMVPILGIAVALVNGKEWWPRLGRSFLVVGLGVGASIALAWIIGTWLPATVPYESNSQITSRVNPNIIDMLIALAAGAAGAYANSDRRASDSVAGVAIAVALVPPLSVVGLNLQDGRYEDAGGAMLLFTTNLVAIILSATVVFLLMGAAPIKRFLDNRKDIQSVFGLIATIALFITIPLSLTIEDSLVNTGRQKIAQSTVEDWLNPPSQSAEDGENPLQLTSVTVADDVVGIAVTGSTQPPPLPPLERQLTEDFGTPVTIRLEFTPSFTYEYSKEEGERTEAPSELPQDSDPTSAPSGAMTSGPG